MVQIIKSNGGGGSGGGGGGEGDMKRSVYDPSNVGKNVYDYTYFINKPTIPTKTSDLDNDSDFVDSSDLSTALAGKQDTLTAGTGIDITSNVISATGGGGSGDVVGPSSSTNGHLAAFDGTTGKLIKDSGLSLDNIQQKREGTQAEYDLLTPTDDTIYYIKKPTRVYYDFTDGTNTQASLESDGWDFRNGPITLDSSLGMYNPNKPMVYHFDMATANRIEVKTKIKFSYRDPVPIQQGLAEIYAEGLGYVWSEGSMWVNDFNDAGYKLEEASTSTGTLTLTDDGIYNTTYTIDLANEVLSFQIEGQPTLSVPITNVDKFRNAHGIGYTTQPTNNIIKVTLMEMDLRVEYENPVEKVMVGGREIQEKLTAGSNITITDNTISATDTTYTAGTGIDITNNVISATGGGGSGDVVGPASSTDGHLAVFDGTTGKLIKDGGETPNTKTFYLSDTSDTTTAQAALDWYLAGKNPIVVLSDIAYIVAGYLSTQLTMMSFYFGVTNYKPSYSTQSYSQTAIYRLEINISSGSVTYITNSNTSSIGGTYLSPGVDYPTPYLPEYEGSPATKKYVDDNVAVFYSPSNDTSDLNSDVGPYMASWLTSTGQLPLDKTTYKDCVIVIGNNVYSRRIVCDITATEDDHSSIRLQFCNIRSVTTSNYTSGTNVGTSRTNVPVIYMNFTYYSGVWTYVSSENNRQFGTSPYVLATNYNYSTPYTPQYPGSPTTKKYVDDKLTTDATTPSSPTEGMIWYDSTNHQLKYYDGSNWKTVTAS